MIRLKISEFRVELAICAVVPLIVLITIALVGYGFIGREKRENMRHVALLDEIPLLEAQLVAAQKSLSGFRISNGGNDNSELSYRVSQAAIAKGVGVKSIRSEKVVPEVAVSCNDYHVQVSGDGPLAALIGWLDVLDQPARGLKVMALRLRPVKAGSSSLYEGESVVHARSLAMHSQPGEMIKGSLEPALAKLTSLVSAVNALAKAKWTELDTSGLDAREDSNAVMASVPPMVSLSLKLSGIINDEHKPLALTDRGLLGEGDVVDGYRVIRVGIDQIVVENGAGQQISVPLYRAEANP